MRNCPVCDNFVSHLVGDYENGYRLHECGACGMRYLVGDCDQGHFDRYYAHDKSPDCNDDASLVRLKALADTLGAFARGVDIGGKWSPLRHMVQVETVNAGEPLTGEYDLFILSHTLEHVYDVSGLMRSIVAHAAPRARVVVEGPLWLDYTNPAYDYHWQHLNKFRAQDYLALLRRYGFEASGAEIAPFTEYRCYRAVGVLCAR